MVCRGYGSSVKCIPVSQYLGFNFGGKWVIYDRDHRGV